MIFNHEAKTISEACGFDTIKKPYGLVMGLLSRVGKEQEIPTNLTQEEKVALIYVFLQKATVIDLLAIMYNTPKVSGAIEALSVELTPHQIELIMGDVMLEILKFIKTTEETEES
jgi:hypothetical protein